ncbi:MAG: efflux RND transporter periplasmic adaptor subunit [Pseudomonadota bacterium]|nr:efflux RND transporter periplasmic adaptor subunit [Pseudomonadota bacterium]MDP1905888.1 efflux RND transporter periplasmic adaptor subunit [Pseudomonadota bacterium]MDP2351760.1 efflux RND transporter periplasmic adaptor subunit [Pseudomonadota bacterium]
MNRVFWLLLALPLAGCGEKAAPPVAQAKMVLAHVVAAGSAAGQAEYSGEVRARHEVGLAFRVGGKVVARAVDVGARVVAGQMLARLDATDLALSVSGAAANLAAAAAERAYAEAEVKRYRDLRAQQFVSAAALDVRETALKATEEKHRALAAQAGLASNQRGYAELRADSAGVVSAVLVESGQVVAAGQPVLRVAKSGEKEVVVAVPENRVNELAKAGEVAVTLWAAPEKHYRGRVREVAPQADPVTRTYAAKVTLLDADAEVRLGQTARVLLKNASGGALTLIPLGSVFQQGTQPAVWLIGANGQVHLRPIQVAAWREDGVAVSGGLAAGERIVAAGAHKLVEGEAVRVAEGGRP